METNLADELIELFPHFDKDIIWSVLASNELHTEKTINTLLSMSDENFINVLDYDDEPEPIINITKTNNSDNEEDDPGYYYNNDEDKSTPSSIRSMFNKLRLIYKYGKKKGDQYRIANTSDIELEEYEPTGQNDKISKKEI